MSEQSAYTEYHPRWYRTRMSTWWWLKSQHYMVFILRELSSVFVAWFVVFFLLLIDAVCKDYWSYRSFLTWAANSWIVVLNVVSLFFVLFHAITWFNLAPKAMVVRMGSQRVPARWIMLSNYGAWAVASALLAWLIWGG